MALCKRFRSDDSMNVLKLLTNVGCIALTVITTGCASSGKGTTAARELDAQSQVQDLPTALVAKVKGAAKDNAPGSMVSLRVRAPNESENTLAVAASDFTRWCQLQGGNLYVATDDNKPDHVRKAERLGDMMGRTAGLETNYFTRSCDVRGDTHVLLGEHVSLGVGGYPMAIRYGGYRVGWLPAQELKANEAAVTELTERNRSKAMAEQAAAREVIQRQAQAADQARRQENARKMAVLVKTDKGTQLVCTGRQHAGDSIANIWYSCSGQPIGTVTFPEFSQNGWRVSSQTLVPVLMTSGNVEHDATVVFEKVR